MTAPATFDDRARAMTHSLIADAARVPSRLPDERRTATGWRTIVVFAATVLVISAAVAGASIALHNARVGQPAPAVHFGHWKAFQLPLSSSPIAVSCPDADNCVAIDYDGEAFVSTDPGGGPSAWKVTQIDPLNGNEGPPTEVVTMTGVSCADPSLCVAVDQLGNVVVSTDPGGGADQWILSGIDGQASLNGISCPDESLCVAVGGINASNPTGVVMTSTNPVGGPGTWKVVNLSTSPLNAVSCPSPSLCVAVDQNGDIVTSTDPTGGTGAWSSAGVEVGNSELSAISCPSAFLCVAVDDTGNVLTSKNPTGGSNAWTITNMTADITGLPNFDSVSCATEHFCVFGALSSSVYMSNDPTGGSSAWIPVQVIQQDEAAMFGLSCPTTDFCVGVDGSAGFHVYTANGG